MLAHAGDVLDAADAVVPVPLHAARQRQRGFNQAVDLARRLSMPLANVLKRVRATSPQSDLPAGRRHANVRDAFVATRMISRWHGATLVLVDDVTTTGATLDACARVLLDVGAREVRAITAARAVWRRP
jgi:ComF family protein